MDYGLRPNDLAKLLLPNGIEWLNCLAADGSDRTHERSRNTSAREEGRMSQDRLTIKYLHAARIILLLVCLANSGCLLATAGVAGGAVAGYAYYKGKVCDTYNANWDDTWAATRTALGELGMPIVKEERKGSEGFLESRTADGQRVRIYVEDEMSRFPAEGKISRVSVRVAIFGDGPVSNRVLDQVGAHLAPAPLLAAPAPPAATGVMPTGASLPASVPRETPPPPLLPPEPKPAG
jgi:hypothetical protein